jgi:hypothetical protein
MTRRQRLAVLPTELRCLFEARSYPRVCNCPTAHRGLSRFAHDERELLIGRLGIGGHQIATLHSVRSIAYGHTIAQRRTGGTGPVAPKLLVTNC